MYVSATSTRLSRGMSTPARRAIAASPRDEWRCEAAPVHRPPPGGVPRGGRAACRVLVLLVLCSVVLRGRAGCPGRLTLALLVARVLADHHHASVATDDLA